MTGQGGARRTKCANCGAPVLCQRVGRVAALDVTADAAAISPKHAYSMTDPNRLAWCLVTGQWRPPEIRWRNSEHIPKCRHEVVIDHQCPPAEPAEPTTLF